MVLVNHAIISTGEEKRQKVTINSNIHVLVNIPIIRVYTSKNNIYLTRFGIKVVF